MRGGIRAGFGLTRADNFPLRLLGAADRLPRETPGTPADGFIANPFWCEREIHPSAITYPVEREISRTGSKKSVKADSGKRVKA